jgi:hypothetical protein
VAALAAGADFSDRWTFYKGVQIPSPFPLGRCSHGFDYREEDAAILAVVAKDVQASCLSIIFV